MNCKAVQRALQPFIDGALPSSAGLAVEAHLAACAACRGEFDALRQVAAALSSEPLADPPDGMAVEIARRAAAQYLMRRRLLIPAWLEALTLGGVALASLTAALIGISWVTALPNLALAPGLVVIVITIAAACVVAAFGSAYYRSHV
jgi:anti-sigma factor RsiW